MASLKFFWEFAVAERGLFKLIGIMTLLTFLYFLFVGVTIKGALLATLVTAFVFGTCGWLFGEVLTGIKQSARRSIRCMIREEMNSSSRDASE